MPERADVAQAAEEQAADHVAPEADRDVVLGQQALVADEDVVLREFGAKLGADRHLVVERDLAELGEAALVAQVQTAPALRRTKACPKTIVLNNTINLLLKLQIAFWQFHTITVSECSLIKLLTYILFQDCIIFWHWKWPAQGTSTVPIVSAHFRFL